MDKQYQTTVELTEELLPQAVLDEQEADRKERTYWTKGVDFCDDWTKTVEKEERLETLSDDTEEEPERDIFLKDDYKTDF